MQPLACCHWDVRRAGILALSAWCGLSFVAVCLAACLGPSASAHACCEKQGGFSIAVAARDCCDVVPGQIQAPAVTTTAPVAILSPAAPEPLTVSVRTTSPLVSASPPIVLRV